MNEIEQIRGSRPVHQFYTRMQFEYIIFPHRPIESKILYQINYDKTQTFLKILKSIERNI